MASLFFSVILSICLLSSPFLSNANVHKQIGFTTDLIHHDSPKSPFFNSKETSTQHLRNAIHRSISLVVHFIGKDASHNSPQTDIISDHGKYLMNISLGTPPVPMMAIADTSTDLVWMQCKPCNNCLPQEKPLFDPKVSSTYKDVSCSSSQCSALQNETFFSSSCSSKSNTCSYTIDKKGLSYTTGNIGTETLTLGSTNNKPVQLKNIIIGCSHLNRGWNFHNKSSGTIGLGGGAVSLISQLGDLIDGKFSYCLLHIDTEFAKNNLTSKINFGINAVVSGTGVVSTPLIKKSPETSYYLTLESISVGNKKFKFPGSDSVNSKGNIIIDSSKSLTFLPTALYAELEDAVVSSIDAERKECPLPGRSLCYSAAEDLKVPVITMHFDGADVNLDSSNSFFHIAEHLVMFAFYGSPGGAIYGNTAQMNFLVGYDTVSKKVSFKPTNCAKM